MRLEKRGRRKRERKWKWSKRLQERKWIEREGGAEAFSRRVFCLLKNSSLKFTHSTPISLRLLLVHLRGEAGLDVGHRALRTTGLTLEEKREEENELRKTPRSQQEGTDLHEGETVLLGEDSVGVLADLAGHVLEDVAPQHGLDLRGLEATLDDQPLASVNRTCGTKLRKQELDVGERRERGGG